MNPIPDDWSLLTLLDHLKRPATYGVVKAGTFVSSGVPMLRGGDIKAGRISTDVPLITHEKDAEYARTRLEADDVVVALVGYPGESAIVPPRLAGANISRAVGLLRLSGGLRPDYLVHFLNSSMGRSEFLRPGAGSAQMVVNLKDLNKLEIPCPPTALEQEAIAEALSDADALIEGLERLIAKKRLIKQGAMQNLLPAKRRLPGFSEEWEVKSLGELVTIVMGQSPRSSSYNSQGDGLPLIQGNADIRDRKAITRTFTREVTKRGHIGDYLMTVRAPVGEIAVTDMDVCLGRGVCALRTNERIIYHIMVSKEPEWAKLSKGSTFDSVNGAEIRSFEVLCPADADERLAIARGFDDMDAEIQALETRLEKARQVKEGMMQNLLTGRIRLV